MSRYITNKKPTLTQRILTTLGFGVSPQKVNCWYCCQDSFLLPGSKNTVRHWLCNLCESMNIRDENGEITDPTAFEASSTRHVARTIERTPSSIQQNSSRTLCSDCVANQEIIYRHLADYIPDESDPTYHIKFNDVDEYKAKLHQRYKLCNDCQQKITKLNEEQREYMRRMRFTASVLESKKPQTLVRPSQAMHKAKGSIWLLVHVWSILCGAFCIMYPPQSTDLYVSMQLLQEWMDNISLTVVKCIFGESDEFCYWGITYQHVVILVLMTVVSFSVKDWHHLLIREAPDKLKNYGLYKNVQVALIFLRWLFFALISVNASQTMDIAVLVVYCSLLVIPYSVVKCAIWPYTLIGKNRREEAVVEEEEEEEDSAEPMDIVPDNPLFSLSPAQQQQQPDAVDSLVNGLHKIAF